MDTRRERPDIARPMYHWGRKPADNSRVPAGCGFVRSGYLPRAGVRRRGGFPTDWISAANGGYPLGGAPYGVGKRRVREDSRRAEYRMN